jgi:hypothetical protein
MLLWLGLGWTLGTAAQGCKTGIKEILIWFIWIWTEKVVCKAISVFVLHVSTLAINSLKKKL